MGISLRTREKAHAIKRAPTLKDIIIPFIPTIDEKDGRLIYISEPFIHLKYLDKVIIIMPFEFSISLEDEDTKKRKETSKIVMLTFWDLLETFPTLNTASNFIIYHDSEIDEIGKQIIGYSNQFWGASDDQLLDAIFISRQIHAWLTSRMDTTAAKQKLFHKELYREFLTFHKRNGIVGLNEHDEIERPFFERALLLRRQAYEKKTKIQASVSGVAELYEQEAYKKALLFWEQQLENGKILYYPPGELPII